MANLPCLQMWGLAKWDKDYYVTTLFNASAGDTADTLTDVVDGRLGPASTAYQWVSANASQCALTALTQVCV